MIKFNSKTLVDLFTRRTKSQSEPASMAQPQDNNSSSEENSHSAGDYYTTIEKLNEHFVHFLLTTERINLVLDIGANEGQYAKSIRKAGYKGKIVSVEPLSDAHKILSELSITDGNWIAHKRSAVGVSEGTTSINVSSNSYSSSILAIKAKHTEAAPESIFIRQEVTPITTVDKLVREYATAIDRVMLKIDVQGLNAKFLRVQPLP